MSCKNSAVLRLPLCQIRLNLVISFSIILISVGKQKKLVFSSSHFYFDWRFLSWKSISALPTAIPQYRSSWGSSRLLLWYSIVWWWWLRLKSLNNTGRSFHSQQDTSDCSLINGWLVTSYWVQHCHFFFPSSQVILKSDLGR